MGALKGKEAIQIAQEGWQSFHDNDDVPENPYLKDSVGAELFALGYEFARRGMESPKELNRYPLSPQGSER